MATEANDNVLEATKETPEEIQARLNFHGSGEGIRFALLLLLLSSGKKASTSESGIVVEAPASPFQNLPHEVMQEFPRIFEEVWVDYLQSKGYTTPPASPRGEATCPGAPLRRTAVALPHH